jgi:hypothetical protein
LQAVALASEERPRSVEEMTTPELEAFLASIAKVQCCGSLFCRAVAEV